LITGVGERHQFGIARLSHRDAGEIFGCRKDRGYRSAGGLAGSAGHGQRALSGNSPKRRAGHFGKSAALSIDQESVDPIFLQRIDVRP
jgi:hypothetical protein